MMKITTFNPQIITKDGRQIIEFFEELGFEKRHDREGVGEMNVEGVRMKDGNGFYLDVSMPDLELQQDMVGIRMNVDDFDEAYRLLTDHGFTNIYGRHTVETGSSRSAVMISPSGFAINLIQHIKK